MSQIDFLLSNYSDFSCSAIILNSQQNIQSESLKPILKNKSPKKMLNFAKFSKNIQKLNAIPENLQQASFDLKKDDAKLLEESNYKRDNYKQDDDTKTNIDLQNNSQKKIQASFSVEQKSQLENDFKLVNWEEDGKIKQKNIKDENIIFPIESCSNQTLETCSSENNSFKTFLEHNENSYFVKSFETKGDLMTIEENDAKIRIEKDQREKNISEIKNEENGKLNSKSKCSKKSPRKAYFRETKVKFKKPLEEVFFVESFKDYNMDMSEAMIFMGMACSCKKNLCEIL